LGRTYWIRIRHRLAAIGRCRLPDRLQFLQQPAMIDTADLAPQQQELHAQ
jgi:hypothetical protein